MSKPSVRQLLDHTRWRAKAVAEGRTPREIRTLTEAWAQGDKPERDALEIKYGKHRSVKK